MGQTQLSFAFCFLLSILHLFLKQIRCLERDQPSGDNECKHRDKNTKKGAGERLGACQLLRAAPPALDCLLPHLL